MDNQYFNTLVAAAQAGERHAQYLAGCVLLAHGQDRKARAWFQRSAFQRSPQGQGALAKAMLMGVGGPKLLAGGLRMAEMAALQGHAGAARLAAECYWLGQYGANPDATKVILFTQIARINGYETFGPPDDDPVWSRADRGTILAECSRLGFRLDWSGPVRTYRLLHAQGVPVAGRASFDGIIRLAAERDCASAASVMCEASAEPAVKVFWGQLAARGEDLDFTAFPGALELWPGEGGPAEVGVAP